MMHWSSHDVTCLYKRESSAKRRKVDLISLFISFIYIPGKAGGPEPFLEGLQRPLVRYGSETRPLLLFELYL